MSLKNKILESPIGYGLWSSMFDGPKIKAICKLLPEIKGKDVLDVGCGPGTNTASFDGTRYIGIDINRSYIETAHKRFPNHRFIIADANAIDFPSESFDCILINSMIHHMNNEQAKKMFQSLKAIIKKNGFMIISEPLLASPNQPFRHFMMNMDRGKFFRRTDEYESLFESHFYIEEKINYPLKIYGKAITVSDMLVARLKKRA